jgi:hypothetical protein
MAWDPSCCERSSLFKKKIFYVGPYGFHTLHWPSSVRVQGCVSGRIAYALISIVLWKLQSDDSTPRKANNSCGSPIPWRTLHIQVAVLLLNYGNHAHRSVRFGVLTQYCLCYSPVTFNIHLSFDNGKIGHTLAPGTKMLSLTSRMLDVQCTSRLIEYWSHLPENTFAPPIPHVVTCPSSKKIQGHHIRWHSAKIKYLQSSVLKKDVVLMQPRTLTVNIGLLLFPRGNQIANLIVIHYSFRDENNPR